METWIACGAGFIPADVVRWQQGIWERHGRSKKLRKVGHRKITAEVLSISAGGKVSLLVSDSAFEITEAGARAGSIEKGTIIECKTATLIRGNVERLAWTEESARAIVASRFLNCSV